MHVHTIPVPATMSSLEAWAELSVFGYYVEPMVEPIRWVNVHCADTDECVCPLIPND